MYLYLLYALHYTLYLLGIPPMLIGCFLWARMEQLEEYILRLEDAKSAQKKEGENLRDWQHRGRDRSAPPLL